MVHFSVELGYVHAPTPYNSSAAFPHNFISKSLFDMK